MKQALSVIILIGLAAGSLPATDDEMATVDELAEASTNAGYPATLIQTDS